MKKKSGYTNDISLNGQNLAQTPKFNTYSATDLGKIPRNKTPTNNGGLFSMTTNTMDFKTLDTNTMQYTEQQQQPLYEEESYKHDTQRNKTRPKNHSFFKFYHVPRKRQVTQSYPDLMTAGTLVNVLKSPTKNQRIEKVFSPVKSSPTKNKTMEDSPSVKFD